MPGAAGLFLWCGLTVRRLTVYERDEGSNPSATAEVESSSSIVRVGGLPPGAVARPFNTEFLEAIRLDEEPVLKTGGCASGL